jgi:hypothetical protein
MKLLERSINSLKNRFSWITVKKEKELVDVSNLHNPPMNEPDFQEILMVQVYDSKGISLNFLDRQLKEAREELEDNLKNDSITLDDKESYFNELLQIYSVTEDKIVIDESGSYHSELIKYVNIEHNDLSNIDNDILQNYLKEFMNKLRNEIQLIKKIRDNILMLNREQNFGVKWNKSDTALIELIVALEKTGSIIFLDRETTQKELVRFFEKLFSFKINPYDSKLSHATTRKKETSPFLSQLLKAFEEDCKRKLE